MTAVMWFRRDLRLGANPAWSAATRENDSVIALFVLDPHLWNCAGTVRGPQLAAHLGALDSELQQLGGRLRVEVGDPTAVVPSIAADRVYWNEDYTPYATARDADVASAVPTVSRHHGCVVHPPGSITTSSGTTYKVFTPFARKWFDRPLPDCPAQGSTAIADQVGDGVPSTATPQMAGGERAAADRLAAFLELVDQYPDVRNRPDLDMTSRLSADLKFGTLSPVEVIETVGDASPARHAFIRQLAWRDFWMHSLAARPDLVENPMRPEFASIAWRNDPAEFSAWTRGKTGYPIVDAGMRQLLAEGWMHNRVRMIVGSFLVKDLLIDWRWGERHFRRHLVDGDIAQNVGNWQWVAGTGADAAPYFRIFNPVTQGKKHDPNGDYVRRWVPELAGLDGDQVHAPWECAPLDLLAAEVELGETYPNPVVDHAAARERTLQAYSRARDSA